MIKYLRKITSSSIVLLLSCFLLLTGLSFFLLKYKINNHSSIHENTRSFSALPSTFSDGDFYYRLALDASMPCGQAPLLLRCLFPSHSILCPRGVSLEPVPGLTPVVYDASPKPLSPAVAENFRQEINLQQDMQRLEQMLTAQPGGVVGSDHDGSLLTDDLDLKVMSKPTGKLMLNPKFPRYCFPISWPFFFRNSFGDPRPGGRLHIGIDIFAEEGDQVYAMTDGVIQQLANWPNAGNTLLLAGTDGRGYMYMHLQKYAEGITDGKAVKKGDLIAYVGHTGTTTSPPHLHFQVHADHSFGKQCALNPYDALVTLCQGHGVTDLGQAQPHFSMARGPDNNLPFAAKKSSRHELFQVVKGMVSVKSALIKCWDVKSSPADDPGLAWKIASPTWKVVPGRTSGCRMTKKKPLQPPPGSPGPCPNPVIQRALLPVRPVAAYPQPCQYFLKIR